MIRLLPLLLATAATPALAQSVTIENFIGRVEMVEGSKLDLSGGDGLAVDMRRNALVVDGGEELKRLSCSVNNGKVFIRAGGLMKGKRRSLESYPTLRITAPVNSALVIRDSVVFGNFSDLGEVDAEFMSCGRAEFSDVSGMFDVRVSGSTDVTAGDVGEAVLKTSGTGNFEIGSAASVAFASSGSGDLKARDVDGPVELRTSGSGDIVIARAGDGVSFRTSGSGDLLAGRVDGRVEVSSTGSGDTEIDEGDVTSLDVRTTGSGDVDIGGAVGAVDVVSTGSGSVTLGSQSGPISHRSTGSGKLVVGGERMKAR